MRITILGSGSKGNSALIQTGQVNFLLDCGFSGKEIVRRLDAVEASPKDLAGIIVSHDHSDHVKGVGILARRFRLPVYINMETYQQSKKLLTDVELRFFNTGSTVEYEDLSIGTFGLSHDAADPAGFTFSQNGSRAGYITDLGTISNGVKEELMQVNALVFEANHDLHMLRNGPYPAHLKRRIRSNFGHLSNDQSAAILAEIVMNTPVREFTLAHLSKNNNDPVLAVEHIQAHIESETGKQVTLHTAPQHQPADPIILE